MGGSGGGKDKEKRKPEIEERNWERYETAEPGGGRCKRQKILATT